MSMYLKKRNLSNLNELQDLKNFRILLNTIKDYLQNKIDKNYLIEVLNDVCTIYMDLDDRDLLNFKGLWSEIDDIKKEIETGLSPFGKVSTNQEDLDRYIDSNMSLIKESCRNLLIRYTPVVEELKKKFPEYEK